MTASYVYGDQPIERSDETMLFDGHGSLRTVTNSSQTVTATGNYEAYGTIVGGTGSSTTPYQHGATSGYRTDGDAGLVHIGARWYDPAIGRWVSADTELGHLSDPLSGNRYVFCADSPVSQVDPSGHGGVIVLAWAAAADPEPVSKTVLIVLLVVAVIAIGVIWIGSQPRRGPSDTPGSGNWNLNRPRPGPLPLPAPRPSSVPRETIEPPPVGGILPPPFPGHVPDPYGKPGGWRGGR